MKMKSLASALALAVCVGCASSSTYKDQLDIGVTSVAAARTTASTLFTAGKLNLAEAKNVEAQCDAIRTTLDALRSAPAGDTASTTLATLLVTIQSLQTYLATKGQS